MKLTIQIAGGILLAGLISWIFWMALFTAAAPQIAAEACALFPTVIIPTQTSRPTPPSPKCENFVQMESGDRHCLENQHPEWRIEPATLPRAQTRSTAR
jgi:hypothetical protein